MSIVIFVSYARKDKKLWEELETTLALPRGNSKVQLWDPHTSIISGQIKQREIDKHLQTARIFLLLLSSDFFVDADCQYQMKQAFMRQQQAKETIYIVPILLRACIWQRDGLEDLQILPRKVVPVTRWADRDEVWVDIAQEIHTIIGYIDNGESNSSSKADINSSPQSQANSTGSPSPQPTPSPGVTPQNETVDIAIIIALKEEMDVLFAELGTDYKTVRDAQAGEVYYTFERGSTLAGRPYRCVATFIGGMGPVRAALLTHKVIERWRPTTLVLPGIAGSLSGDARIGDIVIADQIDGYLENAKATPGADGQGYDFALSGEVYRASRTLLKAVQNFDFSNRSIFEAWHARTEELQKQLLGKLRYKLLGDEVIREHAQIVTGHLASGPVVGAARAFTDWLKRRDRKYMAIEMEAAGLMAAVYDETTTVDTLVLRAISDDSNEQKSTLDATGQGALRRYAMQNAIQLLWSLLDAGLLQQR